MATRTDSRASQSEAAAPRNPQTSLPVKARSQAMRVPAPAQALPCPSVQASTPCQDRPCRLQPTQPTARSPSEDRGTCPHEPYRRAKHSRRSNWSDRQIPSLQKSMRRASERGHSCHQTPATCAEDRSASERIPRANHPQSASRVTRREEHLQHASHQKVTRTSSDATTTTPPRQRKHHIAPAEQESRCHRSRDGSTTQIPDSGAQIVRGAACVKHCVQTSTALRPCPVHRDHQSLASSRRSAAGEGARHARRSYPCDELAP